MRTLMKIVLTIPLLLLPFIVGLPPARAAAITVTMTADSGPGSLRQAIIDANSDPSSDTINFDSSLSGQTITLSSILYIDTTISIDGGNNNITISGNNTVQVFAVSQLDGNLTLLNLTVANGRSNIDHGGGIYNLGSLAVTNCTFSNNSANQYGGGIFNDNGTLTVTNCTFSGNSAAHGGGIFNIVGSLTISGCTFSNNTANTGGGGIYSDWAPLTVTNSTFSSNSAAHGGGIFNTIGSLTVTGCTFSGNTANNQGGGICNRRGLLTAPSFPVIFTNCTFKNNSAANGGGGACISSTDNTNCNNCTFTNCTFSNNTAAAGGGGIWNGLSAVTLTSCIVWDSLLGGDSSAVSYSDIDDAGYAGSNNNISAEPLLGILGDYGGPVQTIPLLPGSPAIDTGNTGAGIPASDARGIVRSSPDMGSFESRGFTMAIDSGSNQTSPPGSPFADPLRVSVFSGNSEPVNGGKVTFTAPGSGASASLDVSPATIASGIATINATANATEGGPYTVTASAAGAAPVTFSLTNQVSADLAVTMSHAADFTPGANATYTITVTNNGPNPAANVTLMDTLPPGMTFVSCTLNPGTFSVNAGTFSGTIGTLAPGGSTTFTLTVNVDSNTISGMSISNTATVNSSAGDPDPANNSATDTDIVIVPVNAGFTITPVTLTLTEGGTAGTFTVCLNSAPTGDVAIPVTSSNTSEITVSPATLTFTGADWSIPQTVTVTPVDDALSDGDQLVKAILGSATSADPHYSGLDPADVNVTVQDNDYQTSSSGGSSPSPVSSTTGSANVIPSLGGKISLGSNITLNIPPNALAGSNSLLVAIRKADPTLTLHSGFIFLGSAYEITVDNQEHYSFNKPVTITFTFDPAHVPDGEIPAIYYYDSSTSRWVRLDGTVSGNTISVTVAHFTIFGVLVKEKAQMEMSISFTDIEDNWAREAIKKLAGMGSVSGYPDGTFRPDAIITRGEFITILVKALHLKSGASVPVFSDTVNHFAKDNIVTAAALGIVRGYNDNTFKPNNPITREQMAIIAIKALKLAETSGETTFNDNSKISVWAKKSVLTAIKNNIIKGYPDNTYKPQGNTTRAEAVSVILSLVK